MHTRADMCMAIWQLLGVGGSRGNRELTDGSSVYNQTLTKPFQ